MGISKNAGIVGNKKNEQLIYLSILLLVASVLVYRTSAPVKVAKPILLQALLGPVDGYRLVENSPLDEDTVRFLDLDDYTQASYEKNGGIVSLYIGYYNNLGKISAAHSPLVCFPGQGWTVANPTEGRVTVGNNEIDYAEMTASLGEQQELVLYWYQAYDKTVPTVYRNKINAVINRMTGKSQEHAFVRIAVPFVTTGKFNKEEARNLGKDFISAFYPTFLSYLNSVPRIVQ